MNQPISTTHLNTTSERPSARAGLPTTPAEMLIEIARICKHDLSDFEALMWTTQIFECYPPEVVMRALRAHMESGTNDANFMPKYGAIKARLEPVRGFVEIEHAVRTGNPYVAQQFNDPVLIQAIHQMGGWERVCAEMPDPRERPIDFSQYVKRFEVALSAAKTKVEIHGMTPRPLQGICEPATKKPGLLSSRGLNVPALDLLPSGDLAHQEIATFFENHVKEPIKQRQGKQNLNHQKDQS